MPQILPPPLHGVRILDLTTMLSGPFATMILADQGADVVKIEAPSGDYTRSLGYRQNGIASMYLNNNRNKRSITLDLKTDAGKSVLKELTEWADVIVENFRPGVAKRLGLNFETLRMKYPSLICVSINGFGAVGPYADKPTYDPIIQAISGLTSIQAGSDTARPTLIRTILADKVTALTAAQAITAALVARAQTGRGDFIELSMLDAVLQFLWASDMNAHTFVDQTVEEDAAASFIDLIYEVADGYVTISVMTDRQWAGLCHVLDVPELIEDSRFSTASAREKNVDERLNLTQNFVRRHKRDDLIARLEKEDVPCAPVLTRSQVWKHPHVIQTNSVLELKHPQAGRIRQSRPAARFSERVKDTHRAGSTLGADRLSVLRELGMNDIDVLSLTRRGAFGEVSND